LASALDDANGQLHTQAAVTPGKCLWSPMNRRLGGLQSPFRRFWERNSLFPAEDCTPISRSSSP